MSDFKKIYYGIDNSCYCQNQKHNPQLKPCMCCKQLVHANCLNYKSQIFQCPSCIVTKLDPLYPLYDKLSQGYLHYRNVSANNEYEFNLEWIPIDKQIEIRCIRICQKSYQLYDIQFPCKLEIYLNKKKIEELLPLRKQISIKRRKDMPINLKKYFKQPKINKIHKILFKIHVEKNLFDTHRIQQKATFFVCICTFTTLSHQQFISKCLDNKISVQESKLLLQNNINSDNRQDDLFIGGSRIPTTCPLTSSIMKYPGRGKWCKHNTCFCLENMSIFYRKFRKYRCPICTKRINEVVIDGYIMEYINKNDLERKYINLQVHQEMDVLEQEKNREQLVQIQEYEQNMNKRRIQQQSVNKEIKESGASKVDELKPKQFKNKELITQEQKKNTQNSQLSLTVLSQFSQKPKTVQKSSKFDQILKLIDLKKSSTQSTQILQQSNKRKSDTQKNTQSNIQLNKVKLKDVIQIFDDDQIIQSNKKINNQIQKSNNQTNKFSKQIEKKKNKKIIKTLDSNKILQNKVTKQPQQTSTQKQNTLKPYHWELRQSPQQQMRSDLSSKKIKFLLNIQPGEGNKYWQRINHRPQFSNQLYKQFN